MTNKEIQDLIKLIDKSELAEVKIKQGDFELSVRSQKYWANKQSGTIVYGAAPSAPAPASVSAQPAATTPSGQEVRSDLPTTTKEVSNENAGLIEVKSPMVGTFYRSASPDKPPYVQVGDVIEAGSVVCIIEAMKLFNEIESDVRGKIVKVLLEDAKPVEYDQPLFLIDPKG